MSLTPVLTWKFATTTGTSVTITNVTATSGSSLVVGLVAYIAGLGSSSRTVTRTGDTYTEDIGGIEIGGINNNNSNGIFSAPSVVTAATNLVASATNGNSVVAMAVEIPATIAKDVNSPVIATGNSGSAASNALTNTTAACIYVGLTSNETAANPATETPGSGWLNVAGGGSVMNELNGSTTQVAAMAFQEFSSVASRQATWTCSASPWGALVAVYKDSGGGAATQSMVMLAMRPVSRFQGPNGLRAFNHRTTYFLSDLKPISDTNFVFPVPLRVINQRRKFHPQQYFSDDRAISGNVIVFPANALLHITGFGPTLKTTIFPGNGSLVLTGFAPKLGLTVKPGNASLVLTTFAPSLKTTIKPGFAIAVLTGFAPSLKTTIRPGFATATLTGLAPNILVSFRVFPASTLLHLTGFAPTIATINRVFPNSELLLLIPKTPTVTNGSTSPRLTRNFTWEDKFFYLGREVPISGNQTLDEILRQLDTTADNLDEEDKFRIIHEKME